jgi:hypothetical protein
MPSANEAMTAIPIPIPALAPVGSFEDLVEFEDEVAEVSWRPVRLYVPRMSRDE